MTNEKTDIFKDLAGGNVIMNMYIKKIREIWQRHANRRTGIIMLSLLLLLALLYITVLRPPENFPTNRLVNIGKGKTLSQITEQLESDNVIRNAFIMNMVVKAYGAEHFIHYGDYLFNEPIGMLEVIKRINNGIFGIDPVTIRVAEGSTVVDISKILEKKMLRFDKDRFLDIAGKYEGYLFPDTYYFLPNTAEEKIVEAMLDNFYKHYKSIEAKAIETGYSLHEIVTLASILELEASKYEDRRKIAGVMYNRLEINMPLQVDVSFVYIMNKGSFDVTVEDMKHKSPYNTYVHKGLPPGPICSPGMSALRAAVNPIKSKWLFYLADKHGTTHYSNTYRQHLIKKRRYIDNR
jgi:UPF0755 protein